MLKCFWVLECKGYGIPTQPGATVAKASKLGYFWVLESCGYCVSLQAGVTGAEVPRLNIFQYWMLGVWDS